MAGSVAAIETKTAYSPENLAEELDEKFVSILERLPQVAWVDFSTELKTLYNIEDVGRLEIKHVGRRALRLLVTPAGQKYGFYKEYQQRYGSSLEDWEHPVISGPPDECRSVVDLSPTVAADFEGCPYELPTLAFTVHALNEAGRHASGPETFSTQAAQLEEAA